MKIIHLYLSRHLLAGAGLALLALVALDGAIDFMDEVKDVGGGYTLGDAVRHTLLTMAISAYELLPVSVLIGGIVSLGNLAAQSELVAFRAVGYSRRRILSSILATGGLLMVLTFVYGEVVLPTATIKSQQIRFDPGPRDVHMFETDFGYWLRDGGRFMHIGEIMPGGRYRNVKLYQLDEARYRLARIIEAPRGWMDAHEIVLHDATLSRLDETAVHITHATELRLPRAMLQPVLAEMPHQAAPAGMNVPDLLAYIAFLKHSRMRHDLHELALWTRFSVPLSILVMLSLAVPWVFVPPRSGGAGRRLFIGIVIGIAYMIFSRVVGNVSVVYQWPAWAGAFLPVLAFLAVAPFILRRMRCA